MRKLAILLSMVVLLALVASVAQAQVTVPLGDQNSWSYGISFSAGTEKEQWNGKILFTDCNGKILKNYQDVLGLRPGSGLFIQAFVEGATTSRKFDFGVATTPTVSDDDLRPLNFDPSFGYTGTVPKEAITQSGNWRTPLQIRMRVWGGEKHFFRVVFKVTYDKHRLDTCDGLFIDVREDSEEGVGAQDQQFAQDTVTTLGQLKQNQEEAQKVLASHGQVINKMQAYLDGVSNSQSSSSPIPSGCFTIQWMRADGSLYNGPVYATVNGNLGTVNNGILRFDRPDRSRNTLTWSITPNGAQHRFTYVEVPGMTETVRVGGR